MTMITTPRADFAARAHEYLAGRRLPEPTDAPPGSPAKIEELARRVARGQQLWHRLDRLEQLGIPCQGSVRLRYAELFGVRVF